MSTPADQSAEATPGEEQPTSHDVEVPNVTPSAVSGIDGEPLTARKPQLAGSVRDSEPADGYTDPYAGVEDAQAKQKAESDGMAHTSEPVQGTVADHPDHDPAADEATDVPTEPVESDSADDSADGGAVVASPDADSAAQSDDPEDTPSDGQGQQ